MKKFLFALILLVNISNISFSQSGWVWQNPTPQGNTLLSIQFLNSLTGYAGSDAGTLLKTTNGGLNWEINSSNIGIAPEKIHFFDVLGREVTTLLNEQLKPGSYETEWDGSNFASGIYFYSLVVGDNTNNMELFNETKKMVLIK